MLHEETAPLPTMDDLRVMFSFGNTYGECWHLNLACLLAALRRGVVTMTRAPIPPMPEVGDHAAFAGQFSGRTGAHRKLCAASALWLEASGLAWTAHDISYPGGRADVSAVKEAVAVECGYTQARKVIDGCAWSWTVVVTPYGEPIIANVFRASSQSASEQLRAALVGEPGPDMATAISAINADARAWLGQRQRLKRAAPAARYPRATPASLAGSMPFRNEDRVVVKDRFSPWRGVVQHASQGELQFHIKPDDGGNLVVASLRSDGAWRAGLCEVVREDVANG